MKRVQADFPFSNFWLYKVWRSKEGRISLVAFGTRAMLFPIDHPDSERVSNTKHVITSEVLDKEVYCGRIITLETQNTIYKEFDDGEYIGASQVYVD